MSRTEKVAVVEGLTARLEEAPFVALADYRGISVAEVSEFRSKLKDAGIHYEVIKNKLAKPAISGTDKEVLHDLLVGMTGWIISGEDPIAAAKMLKAETKALVKEGKFTVKGGFFDGDLLDSKGVSDVAELPSKEELFAMLGDLASFERPKKLALLAEEFTVENGLMTPTLKVKRRELRDRLADVISALYDDEAADLTAR